MFDDLKNIATEKATINIRGHEEEVRKLTVSEMENYQKILNKGIGKVKTNLSQQEVQQALLDIIIADTLLFCKNKPKKVGEKQSEADRYLIKRSFSEKGEESSITDDDIDELYDVYNEVVQQLHIINGINVVDNNNVEEKIKK